MNEKNKRQIITLFRAQADMLEKQSAEEAVLSAAAMCSSLLRVSEGITAEADVSESLYAQYLDLAARVERFFASEALRVQNDRNDIHSELLRKLSTARDSAEHMRCRLSDLESEEKRLDEELERYRDQLTEKQREVKQRENDRREIEDKLSGYSPEAIEKLREENIRLAGVLENARARTDELSAQKKELQADIDGVQREIDRLPEQNRQLAEEYLALQKELALIQNADESCNHEAQNEIRRQIEELRPVALENSQAARMLTDRLEDIRSQNTVYCREKHELSVGILAALEAGMDDLEDKLVDHEGRLKEIKAKADRFAERIGECQRIKQGYADWLSTDTCPLETLAASLSRSEAECLRKSFDPASVSRFGELRDEIESRLREMDELLKKASGAAYSDRQNINRRARN